MSRIAKNSINISESVTCKFENGSFHAKGKLGEMSLAVNNLFKVEINEKEIYVLPKDEKDKLNPIWGTTRSLINNIVQGVDEGFSKTLELNGTGYRASVSGNKLKLQLGFSHDIDYDVPKEVKKERLDIINSTQEKIVTNINKKLIGSKTEILIEGQKEERWYGRNRNDKIVFIDDSNVVPGSTLTVQIEKSSPWYLEGSVN